MERLTRNPRDFGELDRRVLLWRCEDPMGWTALTPGWRTQARLRGLISLILKVAEVKSQSPPLVRKLADRESLPQIAKTTSTFQGT